MGKVIFNGEIVRQENVKINLEDRGFQFGDGVYEVIRIYNGKPFALMEHIDRLFASAEEIFMEISTSKDKLIELITDLIALEGGHTCNLYIQVTRGVAIRNHVIPENASTTLIGYIMDGARPNTLMQSGAEAVTSEDLRWQRCDIKSISLLGNVLAKKKATDANCLEAILHRNHVVTEGSSTNVWIVTNGKIFTHPANNYILNGITRQKLISIIHHHKFSFEERPFTIEQLLVADEVFITSTTLEIIPIVAIDEKKINNGIPGNITRSLQRLFQEKIEKECGSLNS